MSSGEVFENQVDLSFPNAEKTNLFQLEEVDFLVGTLFWFIYKVEHCCIKDTS